MNMSPIELALIVVTLVNGSITIVKPVARVHARLDVLEARLDHITRLLEGGTGD